jgi:hypothetical protein
MVVILLINATQGRSLLRRETYTKQDNRVERTRKGIDYKRLSTVSEPPRHIHPSRPDKVLEQSARWSPHALKRFIDISIHNTAFSAVL